MIATTIVHGSRKELALCGRHAVLIPGVESGVRVTSPAVEPVECEACAVATRWVEYEGSRA